MIVGSVGEYWKEAKCKRTTPRARTKKYSCRISKTDAAYLLHALSNLTLSNDLDRHDKLKRKLKEITD